MNYSVGAETRPLSPNPTLLLLLNPEISDWRSLKPAAHIVYLLRDVKE
jgi:hypothetical protein